MSGWLLLLAAVVLEVAGTTCMKQSDGLSKWLPTLGIVVFYAASFMCLTLALKTIDIAVAYAVWAGLGVVLISLIAVWFFEEPLTLWRSLCIVLVLVGVIGLNLSHG